ncbi:GDP-L-fucose synthase [Rhodovulum iodosum]|uniref:GDP-L-fucose synthase n=1 Tax=Rhodovulum iodosum TaxID=68291 RepID=A0ABV3XRE5_9RHOB|nr:GDP-L-fucose synthase [Rhodovulum robiginosum]RSK32917.1 GDP-L-fucose synthase [Rhodovulum robiginosum]
MKVFLTGGSGMVGRNVIEAARAAQHDMIAPGSRDLDLTDRAATFAAIAEIQPDIVIHAAGRVGGIQANIANPVGFLVDNLDMGMNVVLAARAANVPRVLNLGSSCMYPHAAPNPLKEELVLTGALEPTNEGYALAKVATSRLCDYVSRSEQGLSYKTLIPCNLYGLHDKFDPNVSHLVPAIIRKVHEAKQNGDGTVEIWGDGLARREFMFSGDLADVIWECVERFDDVPSLMNVGIGRDYTINEYYQAAAEVIGWSGEFVHDVTKPVGMKQKLVSNERLTSFGWTPETSLKDGLAKTYEHFLAVTKQQRV